MLHPIKEGIDDDVQETFIAECRIACGQLESFIDHRGILWEYRLKSDGSGGRFLKRVRVVGEVADRGFVKDLPGE